MPTYHPTPGNASQLNFQFGYINTSGNLIGTTLTVDLTKGIGFVAGDVGLVIQIVKPGAPGYPIWAQVATYIGSNSVTITVTPGSNQLNCQVVLYRGLPTHAHIRLDDGVSGTSSIRNLPTMDFSVYSSDGVFAPKEGQPVLVTHATYGDLFGGYIEQATIDNSPGNLTITTKCECVAWDKRLSQRLLYLANENNPSTTEQFVADGSSREYHLLAVPTNVTAVSLIGSIAVSGGVGTLIYGAQFYAGIGTSIVMAGVTYPISSFPTSTTVNIGGSPPDTSGVGYSIPQTLNTAGSDTVSQWFWDQASNTITQGYQAGNSLSETLQPYGGVFNMVSVTFNYSAQLVYENISVSDLVQAIMGLIADEGFSVIITLAGGAPSITQIQFTKRDTPQSALQAIVDQINDGTTNYWFRSTPRKTLLFEILGVTRAAPWNISSLDGSDGNVAPVMSNSKTLEKYVNSALVDVAAAQGSQQLTQNIVGGSPPRRSWGVSAPVAATPTIIRNTFVTNPITGAQKWVSAPQTVGLLNDPLTGQGQMWYWSPGSPSITQDPVIGFALGYTFGGVALPEVLVVTFYPQVSLVQSYVDTAAVAARVAIEGGSGEYDTYVTPKSLANISGSANANYAQAVVGTYHDVSQTVDCTSPRGGLFPGMSIVVHIDELGVNLTMVVDKVNLSEEQDILRWTISLAFGAVIGDYRTAWKSVGGSSSGISGLGNQGTVPPAGVVPGDVTIGTVIVDPQAVIDTGVRPGANPTTRRRVTVPYAPPVPVGTFTGVMLQVEAPDESTIALDTLVTLSSKVQLGGAKDRLVLGPFSDVDVHGVVTFLMPSPDTYPMTCRVRVVSVSAAMVNDYTTAPSVTFVLSAPTPVKPNSGVAHTRNATSITVGPVTDAMPSQVVSGGRNPKGHGPTIPAVSYSQCDVTQGIPDDPAWQGSIYTLVDAKGNAYWTSPPTADTTVTLRFPTPTTVGTYILYAPGWDGQDVNPIIPGITPSAPLALGTTDGTVQSGQLANLGSGLQVIDNSAALKYGAAVKDDGLGSVTLDLASGLHIVSGQAALKYGALLADDGLGAATVKIAGPLYADIAGNLNLKIAPDFVVSGGVLTVAAVNLANAYGFDTSQFSGGGGTMLAIDALGVNKLIAGDALFLGTATFAYSGGGKLTLNSSGLTIADHNTSPNATVTLASTGATIAKGANNVQVTATGVAVNGPSGSLTATSGGVVLTNTNISCSVAASSLTLLYTGGSSLALTSSGLTIANGSYNLTVTASSVSLAGVSGSLTATVGGIAITNTNTSLTVSASQLQFIRTGAGTLTMDAISLTLTHGTSSVAITASAVTIVNGVLTSPAVNGGVITGSKIVLSATLGLTSETLTLDPSAFSSIFQYVFTGLVTYTITMNNTGVNLASTFGGGSTTALDSGQIIFNDGMVDATALSAASGLELPGITAKTKISVYDTFSTAGSGVVPIYAAASFAGQMAAIGATNLRVGGAVAPAGTYRVTCSGGVSATGTGAFAIVISWNDGTVARSLGVASQTFSSTTNYSSGALQISTDGVHDVQYSVTYTGGGGAAYDGAVTMERVA